MARLHFDSLVGNTFGRLAGAKALIEHADQSIPEMERRVQNALKTQAEREGWEYDDYDVARQDLEADYQHWIPKYTGYSALILLWSIVETQLFACADRVAKDKTSAFRVRDIKGKGLEAPVLLVRVLAGIDVTKDPAWPRLKDLQAVRNIIVHRNGARGESEQQQNEFDNLISHNKNLAKTEDVLSGEELWVSTQFCLALAAEIEQFFRRVFSNLGLPGQGVTIES